MERKKWQRIGYFLFAVVFSISMLCFSACKKDVKPVVIVTESNVESGYTLLDVMEAWEEDGKLTFTIENGMITKLNGVKNSTNSYWMLYTSDSANANEARGVYEYGGETYGSAVLGVSELVVIASATYVWVYQTF